MTEETTRQFIQRRKKELAFQISALRGQLAPKEAELAELQRMEAALTIAGGNVALDWAPGSTQSYIESFQKFLAPMTIKEMIVAALRHHFRDGATPSELSEYMKSVYGREVDRNSISPQLARLRDEGIVQNANAPTESGKWYALPGASPDDLIALGHWPPGAQHPKKE